MFNRKYQLKDVLKDIRWLIIGLIIVVVAANIQWSSGYLSTGPAIVEAAADSGVFELQRAFVDVAKKVIPSVVTISTTQTVTMRGGERPYFDFREFFGEDFFKRFPIPEEEKDWKRRGLGSGIIVDPKGYILTNGHVVKDADEIDVILSDKREFRNAQVVGTDPLTDVALVKIDGVDLPVAQLGDSDEVQIGEIVFAVGSPLSLSSTMTQGIVSALGRDIDIIRDSAGNRVPFGIESFIQTDAAINPGNSGGPLVNLEGEVIGINTAIATPTGSYAGYGFAIPINLAKKVMNDFIEHGKVIRAYLGVSLQAVDEDMAKSLKLDRPKGVAVGGLLDDGPAKDAGIRVGDVIVAIDGAEVNQPNEVQSFIAQKRPGDQVKIDLIRKGKKKTIKVKLGERDTSTGMASASGTEESHMSDIGLSVQFLTKELAEKLELSDEDQGVVVVRVKRDSPAAEAGIRANDLIYEIDYTPIVSITDFQQAIGKLKPGDTGLFFIKRRKGTMLASVRLPEE